MSDNAPSRSGRVLVGTAIVLLALNLRLAVGSIGVVLESVRDAFGMSTTVGGILTTLPVVCFAIFGVSSAGLVRRLGLHRTAAVTLVMMAAGLAARSLVHDGAAFLLLSAFALAGTAVGNVILPPLVKVHFPDRIPLLSSLYGAALLGGASLSSIATVPLSDALGGWRSGIGIWAAFVVVTLLPWLTLLGHDVHTAPVEQRRLTLRDLAHSPLGWAMVLCFAVQSAIAYSQFGWFAEMLTDAGVSHAYAGTLLGVISGVGIPLTLSLPRLIRLAGDTAALPWFFAAVSVAGWIGVLTSPTHLAWIWAVLLGLGGGAFTWTLTMIAQRTRTAAGTTALSVATQGVGYLIAGVGPFGVGALHDATGSWTVPILALIVLAALIAVFGTIIAKPRMLEDTLR